VTSRERSVSYPLMGRKLWALALHRTQIPSQALVQTNPCSVVPQGPNVQSPNMQGQRTMPGGQILVVVRAELRRLKRSKELLGISREFGKSIEWLLMGED
jgi:hypothetical protein